ncbi:beta-alanine-activating enzyme-like [Mus caroli]|uniref:Beta-alanine-activating enzyme-like n=1 Tax=Mus caroli TaxID=10089 RepID=A0A6P7R6J1_MUSCR|nr:beta-alanine-activating enzyme-like [Mus caroli]
MTLQELVLQTASVYMDRTAVCFDEGNNQHPVCYTYKALLSKASELSGFLSAHCDFGGIREIGLYCQPGINLPSWILGILQIPTAYAPIDPDSPPSLSTYFMKKCDLKYVLIEKQQLSKFKSSHETVLNYDTVSVEHKDLALFRLYWEDGGVSTVLSDRTDQHKVTDGEDRVSAESRTPEKEHMDMRHDGCLAYVLHTSGTTGTPKTVRVPHACILPNIQHFRDSDLSETISDEVQAEKPACKIVPVTLRRFHSEKRGLGFFFLEALRSSHYLDILNAEILLGIFLRSV